LVSFHLWFNNCGNGSFDNGHRRLVAILESGIG
jgi:hypothetical protein